MSESPRRRGGRGEEDLTTGLALSADEDLRLAAAVDVQIAIETVHGTARAGVAVKRLVFLHEPNLGGVLQLGNSGCVDADVLVPVVAALLAGEVGLKPGGRVADRLGDLVGRALKDRGAAPVVGRQELCEARITVQRR